VGLPVRLVAAMHDTSLQMIERHYSAHIVDALDELAARAVVPLAPAAPAGVVPIRGGALSLQAPHPAASVTVQLSSGFAHGDE
jgi:hypothetical protein